MTWQPIVRYWLRVIAMLALAPMIFVLAMLQSTFVAFMYAFVAIPFDGPKVLHTAYHDPD